MPPLNFHRLRRLAWLLPALALALSAQRYRPCLGCAEHIEYARRWHRPFLALLVSQFVLAGENFALEAHARSLGLCEADPLMRNPIAVNQCHAFSWPRALLIEAPLEALIFDSPAWGLARAGHARWGLSWELVPIIAHAWAIRRTAQAIHRWEREQLLYH